MSTYEDIVADCLPRVERPARYVGAVMNAAGSPGAREGVRVTLASPDLFEMGMSDPQLLALYHFLSSRPGLFLDLCFAPWTDLEQELRRRGLPLCGLLWRRPLHRSDLIGFLLERELQYTNVLTMLDLAGVPLLAADRRDEDPFVVGTGRFAGNPEPMASFLDAVVVGDGEEPMGEIADLVAAARAARRRRGETLRSLADVAGVYVPSLFAGTAPGNGALASLEAGVLARIDRRIAWEIRDDFYPAHPLVPLAEIGSDSLALEIMRGCGRGCAFCSSDGARTVRRALPADVARRAALGVQEGGWEGIALVSGATRDGDYLLRVVEEVDRAVEEGRAAVTLPRLRPQAVTAQLLEACGRVRRGALRLAPDFDSTAGGASHDEGGEGAALVEAVRTAARADWRSVEIELGVGRPGETGREELSALARLIRQAAAAGRRPGGGRMGLLVTLRPFVPRAHSPSQWERQAGLEEMREWLGFLRSRLQSPRVKVQWPDAGMVFIGGLLARGGRELGPVVREAWARGARFDARSDAFHGDRWLDAFRSQGISPERYLAERAADEPLPWEHLRMGLTRSQLELERGRMRRGEPVPACHMRGFADPPSRSSEGIPRAPADLTRSPIPGGTRGQTHRRPPEDSSRPGAEAASRDGLRGRRDVSRPPRIQRRAPAPAVGALRIRLGYSVQGDLRFLSHLDMVRLFHRLIRRTRLNVAYSQGLAPHPRIAFGPPRAVGMASEAEFVDLALTGPYTEERHRALEEAVPEGMKVLRFRPLYGPRPAPEKEINCGAYRVQLLGGERVSPALSDHPDVAGRTDGEIRLRLAGRAHSFAAAGEMTYRRVTPKKAQEVDLRGTLMMYDWATAGSGALDLLLLVRLGGRGRARPAEVAAALLGLGMEAAGLLRVDRLGLYYEAAPGEYVDPFSERHSAPWPVPVRRELPDQGRG